MDGKTALKGLTKAAPRTLYIHRNVLNAAEIIKWAKGQGFKTTLPAEDMHVTICYSRTPIDWMTIGEAWSQNDDGSILVKPGNVRLVEALGDKGAVVLMFNSNDLVWRHEDLKRLGATWDHDGFQPHITITYDAAGVDLAEVEPYLGKIKLGPEIFEEVDEDWSDDIVDKLDGGSGVVYGCTDMQISKYAKVCKVDEELGLVFGWAIVCKENGKDYYDLNIDKSGERVPEHIPEATMLKAATDFMGDTGRPGNEMHRGAMKGKYVFAFPMTTEIAKALGFETKKTGLIVAYKAPADVLAKYKDGTYTGFSIEGTGEGREQEIAA